jgi:hypothetical protein
MNKPIFAALMVACSAIVGRAQNIVDLGNFLVQSNVALVTNLTVGTLSIDCSQQQNIAVEWTVTPSTAGVTAVQGVYFTAIAVPGTRATQAAQFGEGLIMRIAASTTPAPITVVTNWNCVGWSRIDLMTISNVTSGAVESHFTNRIRYALKPNAP